MPEPQPSLFEEPTVVLCQRCAKRCRAGKGRADSRPFRKAERGMCLECCVCALFQRPTDGDAALPTALAMAVERGFKPEDLRLPHIQETFARLLNVGKSEATMEEIDWDEVIANWPLPFPGDKKP
jgi:hypothetical protein